MLKTIYTTASFLLVSTPAFAQEEGGAEFSTILLTIAIVLGILSSLYVFILSGKMKGGQIGAALFLYGLGMSSVVVSLLSVTWLGDVLGPIKGTLHDVFFIIGFLIMVLGSYRVAKIFRSQ